MTVGVNSDELIGGDMVGSVLTGFDKIFVLFRSVRNVSVVIFFETAIGILVNSCIVPELLAVKPRGYDEVFITVPFDECTFITAFSF
jgi:hypothetical protein